MQQHHPHHLHISPPPLSLDFSLPLPFPSFDLTSHSSSLSSTPSTTSTSSSSSSSSSNSVSSLSLSSPFRSSKALDQGWWLDAPFLSPPPTPTSSDGSHPWNTMDPFWPGMSVTPSMSSSSSSSSLTSSSSSGQQLNLIDPSTLMTTCSTSSHSLPTSHFHPSTNTPSASSVSSSLAPFLMMPSSTPSSCSTSSTPPPAPIPPVPPFPTAAHDTSTTTTTTTTSSSSCSSSFITPSMLSPTSSDPFMSSSLLPLQLPNSTCFFFHSTPTLSEVPQEHALGNMFQTLGYDHVEKNAEVDEEEEEEEDEEDHYEDEEEDEHEEDKEEHEEQEKDKEKNKDAKEASTTQFKERKMNTPSKPFLWKNVSQSTNFSKKKKIKKKSMLLKKSTSLTHATSSNKKKEPMENGPVLKSNANWNSTTPSNSCISSSGSDSNEQEDVELPESWMYWDADAQRTYLTSWPTSKLISYIIKTSQAHLFNSQHFTTSPFSSSSTTTPSASSSNSSSFSSTSTQRWVCVKHKLAAVDALGQRLPSYEDLIAEALHQWHVDHQDPWGCQPRFIFKWMAEKYKGLLPLNFKGSATQALKKAWRKGRFLRHERKYRINPHWKPSPTSSSSSSSSFSSSSSSSRSYSSSISLASSSPTTGFVSSNDSTTSYTA